MIRALILVVSLLGAVASPALAQSRAAVTEVDVQIVLAVDISYSMDPEEQRLQREGYIKAITSQEVIDAIRKGLIGKIAVAYLEWAGHQERQVVIDWRIIDGPETARAFAAELEGKPYRRAFRTSISGGIQASVDLIEKSGIRAMRRVIDVSGDGSNNSGPHVEIARDDALAKGIVINGLPILMPRANQRFVDIPNLDVYYQDCVVGGPGSFMIPITTPEEFITATRRKLILEVAGITPVWPLPDMPGIVPAQNQKADCLAGERLWRERWERN